MQAHRNLLRFAFLILSLSIAAESVNALPTRSPIARRSIIAARNLRAQKQARASLAFTPRMKRQLKPGHIRRDPSPDPSPAPLAVFGPGAFDNQELVAQATANGWLVSRKVQKVRRWLQERGASTPPAAANRLFNPSPAVAESNAFAVIELADNSTVIQNATASGLLDPLNITLAAAVYSAAIPPPPTTPSPIAAARRSRIVLARGSRNATVAAENIDLSNTQMKAAVEAIEPEPITLTVTLVPTKVTKTAAATVATTISGEVVPTVVPSSITVIEFVPKPAEESQTTVEDDKPDSEEVSEGEVYLGDSTPSSTAPDASITAAADVSPAEGHIFPSLGSVQAKAVVLNLAPTSTVHDIPHGPTNAPDPVKRAEQPAPTSPPSLDDDEDEWEECWEGEEGCIVD